MNVESIKAFETVLNYAVLVSKVTRIIYSENMFFNSFLTEIQVD